MNTRPGFLLIDKPSGWTSHDVVAKVRNLVGAKVGHAGTLDPMATGLLVLGIGRATRLLRFVQAFEKEYVATAQLGVATDSLDADGAVLDREPLPVDADQFRAALERFVGPTQQLPPMVSARKVGGRRLYAIAREGGEVEREARTVMIHDLELIDFAPSDYPQATFRVVCGSGTYVRSLADDVAGALGGRAHLIALRRVRNGSLDVAMATTIEALQEAAGAGQLTDLVVTPAAALRDLPGAHLDGRQEAAVRSGAAMAGNVAAPAPDGSLVRMLGEDDSLLGVYRVAGDVLKPEVVTA